MLIYMRPSNEALLRARVLGAGSARVELRQGRDPVYGASAVETGTAERETGERRGGRAFTVTERMGESGRGALLAI